MLLSSLPRDLLVHSTTTTLWESRSTSTPSGQLALQAAEYYYAAWAESVKLSSKRSFSPFRAQQIICEFIASLRSSKALYCINGRAVYEVTARDGTCQVFGLKYQRALLETK
jgi:hypothetical protein